MSSDSPSLPQGWSCHVSKSTGKNFYFNKKTGASVWNINELPRQSSDSEKPPPILPRQISPPPQTSGTGLNSTAENSKPDSLGKRIPSSAEEEPDSLSKIFESSADPDLLDSLRERITNSSVPEPGSLSMDAIQDLLGQHKALQASLRIKPSEGGINRVSRLQGLNRESGSSVGALSACTVQDTGEGMKSGIGRNLRRKVNLFHHLNLEKESKRMKSSFKENDKNLEIEEKGDSNQEQEIIDDLTSKEPSDEDDEADLYGADPDELEALSRLKD